MSRLAPAGLRSASPFAVTNPNRLPVLFVRVFYKRANVSGEGGANVGAVVPAVEGSLDVASRRVPDDLPQLGLVARLALSRHQLRPVAPEDAAARFVSP